ncbi:MAG: ABC transporter substrate-binding protein [Alphaproteobacteria bacterium]|nr:ABC transporter substrate-binding protein [Alphaproteobacteria bacterium]
MIRLRAGTGLAAAALLLAGCADVRAPEPTAQTLPAQPTIVSLNPCSDAVLAELAGPEQLLAVSHYSHDPRASSMDVAQARRYRATGGTVEEVLALDPDVVVAGAFLAPATRAALEDMGIAVVTFGAAGGVEDSLAQVRELARLSGHEAAGEALAARIAASAVPVQGARVGAVLWQSGGIVAGEAALVTDLLGRAGFTSHSAARGLGQADYLSLERVAADPPELLLVAGSEPGQQHPLLEHLTQTRVEPFDPGLVYCGGPTIIRAMERLRGLRSAMLDRRLASAAAPR